MRKEVLVQCGIWISGEYLYSYSGNIDYRLLIE